MKQINISIIIIFLINFIHANSFENNDVSKLNKKDNQLSMTLYLY
jgi:hypothetical protein